MDRFRRRKKNDFYYRMILFSLLFSLIDIFQYITTSLQSFVLGQDTFPSNEKFNEMPFTIGQLSNTPHKPQIGQWYVVYRPICGLSPKLFLLNYNLTIMNHLNNAYNSNNFWHESLKIILHRDVFPAFQWHFYLFCILLDW